MPLPPLTSMHAPLIIDDSAEARNSAALAISCGLAGPWSGLEGDGVRLICANSSLTMGVSVMVGQMQLTRMLKGASSAAKTLVNVITAPLELA